MASPFEDDEVAARVEALLSRMSLDQKIGQMTQPERMAITPREARDFHIGSVLSGGGSSPGDNLPADWVAMSDAYWAASMEADEKHLAIPVIYGVDAVHGNNNVIGATVFPHNIGLGAANDPALIRRIAEATAKEVLATGVEWTFAPTLAVARDCRWGRTYESFAEVPEIVSRYAPAFVEGLQGDLRTTSVVACAKHWVGDGGTRYGVDQGETTLSFEELERLHIAPYRGAIESGVLTIMASFNSWNGDKCHGHRYLLTDILKGRLGFRGFVVSDWDGVDYLADDYREAVALSANAGVDMFMVSEKWREFIDGLRDNVLAGIVSIDRVDDAVRRILTVKTLYGLFERPRPANRRWSNHESFGGRDHRNLAREAVRKSLVLLKNDDGVLPLSKSARVLVAGKSAHDKGHQCGGFTVAWQGAPGNELVKGGTSLWEGIADFAGDAELSVDGAAADAGRHDVAIVAIGERPYAEGMGDIRAGDDVIVETGSQVKGAMKVLEAYGSTLELQKMHPEDIATLRKIADEGIPIVAVLISGRPLVVNAELALSKAFVAAWLPGSEGKGVAEVLFGEEDFQGRLSFSWPREDGAPGVDDQVDRRSCEPLFPLAYGLTYSK